MRRIGSLLLAFFIIFALTACSPSAASEKQKTEEQTNMDENRKPTSKKSEMPITDAATLWLLRNAR